MMKPLKARLALATVLALLVIAITSQQTLAVTYTYTGTGGDANDWQDTGNWSGGANYPGFAAGDDAIVPDGFGPSFTNVPSSVQSLTTGNTAVTVNNTGTLSFAGTSAGPRAGSGGLTFTNNLQFVNGAAVLQANGGTLSGTSISWGNTGVITQTLGGTFSFSGTFNVPSPSTTIQAWQFTGATPTLFSAGFPAGSYTFAGTPNFGGHRPNWRINGTSLPAGNQWDLNGQTIFGNTVSVNGGNGTPFTRHGYLTDNVGGTIDANVLEIGTGGYLGGYLNLHNTQVTLQGSGTIYNNQSLNNDGTSYSISGGSKVAGSDIIPAFAFNINDGTTFTLNPTGGTANMHTGSVDNGLSAGAFDNNFAFDQLEIPIGNTITLIGNDNFGGSFNALYATNITGGGVLELGDHNVYLFNQLGNDINFLFSGTGQVFFLNLAPVPEPSSLLLLGIGVLGLVRMRKRRANA